MPRAPGEVEAELQPLGLRTRLYGALAALGPDERRQLQELRLRLL